MSTQLLKLSFNQGYEDTLVALGFEKQAFIWGAAGKMLGAAGKGIGNLIAKAGQKKLPNAIGKPMGVMQGAPAQIGSGVLREGVNTRVTEATV